MFNTFCVIYDIPNYLPFSMSNIALFVSNLYTQSFPPKTILTYLSAIGYLHKVAGHSDPAQLFFIQRLVAGAYQLGNTFDIRLPITHQILIQILDSIPQALTDNMIRNCTQLFFYLHFQLLPVFVSLSVHHLKKLQMSFNCLMYSLQKKMVWLQGLLFVLKNINTIQPAFQNT